MSIRSLPGKLYTIPDGETGSRHCFAMWQDFVFPPQVLGPFHRNGQPLETTDFECSLDDIKPTKYDEMAIESYQTFCKLKRSRSYP